LPTLNVAGQVIVVPRGYFDGSGNENPYRTLGGLAGTDEVWAEFEGRWNQILASHPLKPAYLHMKEAAHTTKEFDRKKGWTDEHVQRLLFDLLKYLQSLDGDKIGSFACTVDAKAHAELIAEGVDVPIIERICTFECCEMAWMWHYHEYKGLMSGVHYFFDVGEPYNDSFDREWQEKKDSTDPFWNLLQTVASVKMRSTPALQGADLVAWAVNRRLQPTARDYGYLDEVIRGAVSHRRSFWDKGRLRKKYARVAL
jgi:hypothetical protein